MQEQMTAPKAATVKIAFSLRLPPKVVEVVVLLPTMWQLRAMEIVEAVEVEAPAKTGQQLVAAAFLLKVSAVAVALEDLLVMAAAVRAKLVRQI